MNNVKSLALIAVILLSETALANNTVILNRFGAPAYYIQQNGQMTTILDNYGRPVGYGMDTSPPVIDSAPIPIPGRSGTMRYQDELFERGLPDIDGRY